MPTHLDAPHGLIEHRLASAAGGPQGPVSVVTQAQQNAVEQGVRKVHQASAGADSVTGHLQLNHASANEVSYDSAAPKRTAVSAYIWGKQGLLSPSKAQPKAGSPKMHFTHQTPHSTFTCMKLCLLKLLNTCIKDRRLMPIIIFANGDQTRTFLLLIFFNSYDAVQHHGIHLGINFVCNVSLFSLCHPPSCCPRTLCF